VIAPAKTGKESNKRKAVIKTAHKIKAFCGQSFLDNAYLK